MEQNRETTKDKVNWNIWIPVLLWFVCVVLGILKVYLRVILFDVDENIEILDVLNTFNSNTFSTFISVVVCKLYQHFSTEKSGLERERISGLSMKNMPYIFIISGIYAMVAVFDTAISNVVMSIIFLLFNLGYIFCFFKIFLAKK